MTRIFSIELLQKFKTELTDYLANHPDDGNLFSLRLKRSRGKIQFYRFNKVKKTEEYVSSSKVDLLRSLAQSDYMSLSRKAVLELIGIIDKCIALLKTGLDPDDVYNSLEPERKALVQCVSTTTVNVEAWYAVQIYKPKGFGKDDPIHIAINGLRVRSKSEELIVMVLLKFEIPFVFEPPVWANGILYHPDFKVLNKRTGKEYYYEHLGSMDKPEYVNHYFFKRFPDYETVGIVRGDNLVFTVECQAVPLTTKTLESFIRKHFL